MNSSREIKISNKYSEVLLNGSLIKTLVNLKTNVFLVY